MPRAITENNRRLQFRVDESVKTRIARAAALQHMDLTEFVVGTVTREADAVIERAETLQVSTRDFDKILDLLEHPPEPNARLKAAISSLPENL